MPHTTSLAEARENLGALMETLHLIRSPRNRERLMEAIESAERGEGEHVSIDQLRREYGLHDR